MTYIAPRVCYIRDRRLPECANTDTRIHTTTTGGLQ
jgi:hypothetical protein